MTRKTTSFVNEVKNVFLIYSSIYLHFFVGISSAATVTVDVC